MKGVRFVLVGSSDVKAGCLLTGFLLWCATCCAPTTVQGLSGGGGTLFLGTGWPSSVDAARVLANDVDVMEETGNYVAGVLGFYQGDRYRIGGLAQTYAWGGVNPGRYTAHADAAGVAAFVIGVYATYTLRHDRVLLNVGGSGGAGRCVLGYTLAYGAEKEENVATFYLEPGLSLGVAATSWFGVEFQLSTPLFLFAEDLALTVGDTTYTVGGDELSGVSFRVGLTFGKIAAL